MSAESYPEPLIINALNARPPIPADRADISDIVARAASAEVDEPGYAWERLPLWLAEVDETYNKIGEAPIVGLDLCSSVPIYAQILRSLEFDRDGVRGRELVRHLFTEEALRNLADHAPDLKPIAHALPRDPSARPLLEAAVQESLYEITPEEAAGSNQENPSYRQRLQDKLQAQRISYARDEAGQNVDIGRGFRVNTVEHDHTYFESLAELRLPAQSPEAVAARERLRSGSQSDQDRAEAGQKVSAGPELAARYLSWQTNRLAEIIVGNKRYRPARFLSADVSDPGAIAASSIANMPETTQTLDVFSHAVKSLADPNQHVTANLFEELPFPDNSLALITCFDAWPFHFQSDPEVHGQPEATDQIVLDTLQALYDKLAYGGKLVVFPWAMRAKDADERVDGTRTLTDIAATFGDANDLPFDMRGIHRNTLHKWMSASDQQTAVRMSPIFELNDRHFFALIISKRTASSHKASSNWLAKIAVQAEKPA